MNEQPLYRHVQEGRAVRAFLFGLVAVLLVPEAYLIATHARGVAIDVLLIVVPILIIAGSMFGSMTIEVTRTELRWWFGVGWPGGRIARAELVGEEIENPGLLNGIGLHLTMSGWLWNVALGPAVALHRSGKLATILGTDDPDGLIAALATEIA